MGSVSHEVDADQHTKATLPLHGSSSRFVEGGDNWQQEEGGGPVRMCSCAIQAAIACLRACVFVYVSVLCLFLCVVRTTDARLVQRDNHERLKGKPLPPPIPHY